MTLGIRSVPILPIRTITFPPLLFVLLVLLLMWSCAAPTQSIPPVPGVSLDGVDPEVRDAVTEALGAAEAQPDSAEASGRLGMVLQANSLYPQAELAYQRAIALEPLRFEWHYYLALTWREQSRLEEAAEELAETIPLRPAYAPAEIKLGELLFELGRLDESAAALESALEKDPGLPDALYTLGRVRSAQGQLEAAETFYRRATQEYATFGPAYFGLATTQQSLGKTSEAERNFALAERYTGDRPRQDPVLGEVLELGTGMLSRIQKAQRLFVEGNAKGAAALFRGVLEEAPNNINALLNLLYIGQVDGEPSMAELEDLYQRARKIAPENPQLYLYYGMTLANANQVDAAIDTANTAVELKPDYAEALTLLGTLMERKNRPDLAIEQYRRAREAQSSYRPAQMQLAQILVNSGRYEEAIPELRAMLEFNDATTPTTLVFLAQAYAQTGDPGRALEYLEHAHALVQRTGPPELLQEIETGLRQLGARP